MYFFLSQGFSSATYSKPACSLPLLLLSVVLPTQSHTVPSLVSRHVLYKNKPLVTHKTQHGVRRFSPRRGRARGPVGVFCFYY